MAGFFVPDERLSRAALIAPAPRRSNTALRALASFLRLPSQTVLGPALIRENGSFWSM